MRKWAIVFSALTLSGPLLVVVLLLFSLGGGSEAGASILMSSPLFLYVDEEQAARYQEICVQKQIPWDLVILLDGMDAYNQNKKNLDKYNPLLTALEFCCIEETEYEIQEVEEGSEEALLYERVTDGEQAGEGTLEETGLELLAYREPEAYDPEGPSPATPEPEEPGNQEEPEATPEASPEPTEEPEEPEMIKVWVPLETRLYTGLKEILDYVEVKEKDVSWKTWDSLEEDIARAAEKKSSPETRFEAGILTRETAARREIPGEILAPEDAEYVLEVWDSDYLSDMYPSPADEEVL